MSKQHAFMQDIDGRLWGVESYKRLDSAKWWQKIFAKISKKYKLRFRDLEPIELEVNPYYEGVDEFKIPKQPKK